jgi:uncharacterized membrane protein
VVLRTSQNGGIDKKMKIIIIIIIVLFIQSFFVFTEKGHTIESRQGNNNASAFFKEQLAQ